MTKGLKAHLVKMVRKVIRARREPKEIKDKKV